MKSKMIVPSYMARFKCIAGKCEETCCAGWYIAIDEATLKKYKKVKKPEMKKRLAKELVEKKGGLAECAAKIKLKNNRCAFLDKQNLCDIYKELGEQYLSETCTMYPRNTNDLGGRIELSLVLSCPEAARQILLDPRPIQFSEQEVESLPIVGANLPLKTKQPKTFEDYIVEMREVLIELIQQPGMDLDQKWAALEAVMLRLNEYKERHELKQLEAFLKEMRGCKNSVEKALQLKSKKSISQAYFEKAATSKMLGALVAMRAVKKSPSARYEACYTEMLEGMGKEPDHKGYQKGEAICKEMFLKEHPYIGEHYLVNYIYERLVPINEQTPLESFKMLCLYISCIRLHLIGMAAYKGSLKPEEAIDCIQSFTRVFDHNELYVHQLKKQLEKA